MAIYQILYGQYYIWDIFGLGPKKKTLFVERKKPDSLADLPNWSKSLGYRWKKA